MVYTMSSRLLKLQAQKVWAQKCDKYVFMGDKDIPELPMIQINFDGPKTYLNMWRKSLAMWKYVHTHFLDDFDYFYTCGDDVFMIVENMRKFLLSQRVVGETAKKKGVYIGHRLMNGKRYAFNAGGPGYVLDRVAVGLVVNGAEKVGLDITPVEDLKVAEIMLAAGVEPMHTEDGVSQRFHLFAPEFYLSFNPNSEKDKDGWVMKGERALKPGFVEGQAGISNETIAFHYCDLHCLWELGRVMSCKK
jgi:glycoprotein-N-acetylgalactosamine 3-beta-galactosyltransferase